MTERQITIKACPPVRGRKLVLVDGVPWARINMDSHGLHGNSYWFQTIGQAGAISEPYDPPSRSGRERTVRVDSDKYARRRAKAGEIVAPLDECLLAQARELIERGLIESPEVVEAKRAEHAARMAEISARQDAEDRIARAAPLLLEACREALAYLDVTDGASSWPPIRRTQLRAMVFAAIDEATNGIGSVAADAALSKLPKLRGAL